jgi:hypothetical protein
MLLGMHFNYPSKILSLTTKVVVNQLAFTLIFISYFFAMQPLLSNDNLSEVLGAHSADCAGVICEVAGFGRWFRLFLLRLLERNTAAPLPGLLQSAGRHIRRQLHIVAFWY